MNSLSERPRPAIPPRGESLTPAQAMSLAIAEAARGAGFVSPNPLVGCTIVDREHRFLAVGYHHRLGEAHAEIDALRQLASPSEMEGAHVYVTLEPCAHQGRTPSCAKTLAQLKPGSVIYAVPDANPIAQNGAEILRAAGVPAIALDQAVQIPAPERQELIALARELAEIFLYGVEHRRPFVAAKVAASLDGCMALVSGESKWITGEESRAQTHLLRAQYDAVLIGRNTFVTDDPSLNVRHASLPNFENRAVLLDLQGRSLGALDKSNLLRVRAPEKLTVVVRRGLPPETLAQAPTGITILEVDDTAPSLDAKGHTVGLATQSPTMSSVTSAFGAVSPDLILSALWDSGVHSLMIEGGAQTYASFFAARRVQRLHLFEAPVVIGGRHGLAWSSQFGVDQMGQRIKLLRLQRRVFGDDLYTTGVVAFPSKAEAI